MNESRLTRRALLFAMAAAAAGAAFPTIGAAQEKKPAAGSPSANPDRIRELEEYYAKLYAQPLQSPERLPKEIAVISLSRIDASATTASLLGVLKGPTKEPVVAYLAWEALHARRASLSSDQQREWALAGARAADAGAFPGWTIAPVLRALAGQPASAFDPLHAKLAAHVIQENALDDERGLDALNALRDWVAAWCEPAVVKGLLALAGKPGLAPRVDHSLRGLPSPPPKGEEPRKIAAAWIAWMKTTKLTRAGDADVKPYIGASAAFALPQRIAFTNDPRWRKELEIGKCTVSDFDLVWCIDSTGSMNEPNQMVARETGTLARVCALVSRRARCGAVYYRHETEQALLQPCCQRAAGNAATYRTKTYKLTPDAAGLAATMAAEPIPKPDPKLGNVHPGSAYYAGLKTAIAEQPWSRDKLSRRVIVLVGDSFLTPGSEKAATDLTAEAARNGYDVHAFVGGRAVKAWADVVKAGGGQMITVNSARRPMRPGPGAPAATTTAPTTQSAREAAVGGLFRSVLVAALTPAVAADYRDRIEPLLDALIPFARAEADAEKAGGTARR